MLPEMRAAADRFIFDVANAKYAGAIAGKRGLERKAPGSDWTVRQQLGHLAFALHRYADVIPALSAGEPANFDPKTDNVEDARRSAKLPLPDIFDTMSAGRDRVIAVLETLDEAALDRPVRGDLRLRDAVTAFVNHAEHHAIDFADALPQARMDPMILNWVLYADYDLQPALFERQQKLAAEVRAAIAAAEDDDDYDDEDDE